MSTVTLSLNCPIIGISFERMDVAKRKLDRAQEEARDEVDSLSKAISSLQVSDGRLRMKAEALNSMRSRINSRMGSLQRMSTHVDYAVKRFKETDSLCEQRIRSNGYECRRALGLKTHGGIFGDIIGGIVSIVDKGKAAWNGITKTVVDFYEKHKVLINNIATIALEVGAVALTVAAIAAGAVTGVGLVLGVIGLAYSLSNIIDSGTKIYNYCTTGVEKGFNPLQEGFQAVLGEELGKKVYDYSNIALGVANVAVAGVGLIKAAKNAWKSGKTLKDIFKIGNKDIGKEGRLIQSAVGEEKAMAVSSNITKEARGIAKGGTSSGFKYEHNPSNNPKVLKDAFEDPEAVYGYRPREDGSLAAFADGDWSNPDYVEYARQNRIDYHNRNEVGTMDLVSNLRNEECTEEQIARAVCEYRNQSRLRAYMDAEGNITNQAGYDQALAHCKTYEQLIAEGKTNAGIVESATRGNPGMDACTGLYDEYYNTYSGGN